MTDRLIYDNNKSEIFCREDPDSGRRVAVKVLNFAFPTPEDIARFYNVLEIAPLFFLSNTLNVVPKRPTPNENSSQSFE